MSFKTVQAVYSAPKRHWVGDGFYVASMFNYQQTHKNVDPFLLLDYAAPTHFTPNYNQPYGVGEHPHRGFETITIAYQGEVAHKDASGGTGVIGAGDVQWMTAGAGVMHEEFHSENFSKTGGVFEMVQLWLNLPAKDKMVKPNYQTIFNHQIPTVEIDGGAVWIIAGDFMGISGKANTFSPVNLWDGKLKANHSHQFCVPNDHNLLILVLLGEIMVNDTPVKADQLVTFTKGGELFNIIAQTDAKFLILSGKPLNEPIAGHGPFVMNTHEEILQAFHDLKSGQFTKISRE